MRRKQLAIELDHDAHVALNEQLYSEFRRLILSGRLSPGDRVPSSRALAESLAISRSTVTETFERLLTEGYLEARTGSGTFVSSRIPEEKLPAAQPPRRKAALRPPDRLSQWGRSASRLGPPGQVEGEPEISFYTWRPAFDLVPLQALARIIGRRSRKANVTMLDFPGDPCGYWPLREQIVESISRSRGIQCKPEQVVVVVGLQHAMDLVGRVHLDCADVAVVEDPGYPRARQTLELNGATILPIPVDEDGIQVDKLASAAPSSTKIAYVTPSHQFPTGCVLSLPRRLELLDWAKRTGAIILEDDYDSEYRYSGRPIPALKGLDQTESVIYVGTFNKVLFPGLAIAYLVVPERLVSVYAAARAQSGEQVPLVFQAAVAEFMQEGHLDRHIKRMREVYGQRRLALVKALKKHFKNQVTVLGDNAGLHVLVRLKTTLSGAELERRAARVGVGIVSTEPYYAGRTRPGEFLIGYGNLSAARIEEGVKRLARVLGT